MEEVVVVSRNVGDVQLAGVVVVEVYPLVKEIGIFIHDVVDP